VFRPATPNRCLDRIWADHLRNFDCQNCQSLVALILGQPAFTRGTKVGIHVSPRQSFLIDWTITECGIALTDLMHSKSDSPIL
jgi:hypothetical protein